VKRRGENMETAFKRYWRAEGRLLCARMAGRWNGDPTEREKKLFYFGFIWGWMKRRDRDAKLRRKRR